MVLILILGQVYCNLVVTLEQDYSCSQVLVSRGRWLVSGEGGAVAVVSAIKAHGLKWQTSLIKRANKAAITSAELSTNQQQERAEPVFKHPAD